ncbi:MAG: hypothetical protein KUG77_10725 [Nannocystaceae bacterium]|nr:hypothetical protein [Nannocystaceae bacterium]
MTLRLASSSHLLLVCLSAALGGCRTGPAGVETPAPVVEPVSLALSLDEIADRIDPGPQEQLSASLPPWMFELIGLDASPSASGTQLLEQSATEQAEFSTRMEVASDDNAAMVSVIRAGARSVVLAEQAAQRGAADADVLARLERAYQAVDVPMLASDRSTFGQFLMMFAEVSAGQGVGPSDAAQFQQLAGVVQGAMRAAGPLHRRTVAELLRIAPDHAAVPTALLAVARAKQGDDEDWTVPAAKLALKRRGTLASAQEQLDLARVCFAGLDVRCGEGALRAAAGASGSDSVAQDAVLARRIVELSDASSLDLRLERARATLKLGRHASAKAELDALRAEFPQDARPVGGLALHAVETEFDFDGAHRLIDAQVGLKNGDAEYYELAIGTRAMAAMSSIVPALAADEGRGAAAALEPLLSRMRADIEGYAALGSSDARYLGLLVDIGEELLAQFDKEGSISLLEVPALGDRVVQLQSEIPTNPHAYRLLMSVSLFEPDKARAGTMAGVRAPQGPEHDAMVLRHSRALLDLAVTWTEASFVRQARDTLHDVGPTTSPEAAELHADALMVQRLLGGSTAWAVIGERYNALLDGEPTPKTARAINNVALALMHSGDAHTAREAWSVSAELSEDHGDVARLNLIASGPSAGDSASLLAMQTLAGETKVAGVRVTALAWALAWAKGKPAQRKAAATLADAVTQAKIDGARPTAPDPYSGLILEGSLQASMGYAVKTGLQIQLDGTGRPWAILAPPRKRSS